MRKILIILVLFNIAFSSFIMGMQSEVTGVERELFEAIEKGNVARVEQLIDEGVNFRAVRMYKGKEIYPLDFAKQKGNSEIVKIIEGAIYYTTYQRFLDAVQEGKIPKIEKIIINGGIGNVDTPKDKDDNTALILAVQKNDVPLVEKLLLWKADINIQNKKGESAFVLALKSKNKLLITALLETAYTIEIDQIDKDGNTPLILAIQNGDLEIIEKIVDEVPNTDIKNLKNETAYNFVKDDTPNKTKILELLENAKKQFELYEAIQKSNYSVLKSSDVPLNISSVERNPLMVALSVSGTPLLNDVLNKKANVNQVLRGRKTPLWIMVSFANPGTFKYFLQKGANPDISDIYDDYTPIFRALEIGNLLLVGHLINAKTNVNYQASSKFPGKPGRMTPLMFAVELGYSDPIKTLLDAGADPLIKNSEGKTALDLAQAKEKISVNKERYQTIITLLEDKIKTIPVKPTTPIKPVTPIPTTSSQLMSLLQNLTQQLRGLLQVLKKN